VIDRRPDAQMLAMLDADPQGWALARSVRDGGGIVDFVLVYVNDAGCRWVGRPRDELVGRRYRELWPETVHDGTLPLYRSVVETGQPATRCSSPAWLPRPVCRTAGCPAGAADETRSDGRARRETMRAADMPASP
jgi:PAS domain-containing protein